MIRSLPRRAPASTVWRPRPDRKSTRLNSSHGYISYAVFCLKNRNIHNIELAVLDGAHAVEREIHLFGVELPRWRAALAHTGGKNTVIDAVDLAAKLLKSAAL